MIKFKLSYLQILLSHRRMFVYGIYSAHMSISVRQKPSCHPAARYLPLRIQRKRCSGHIPRQREHHTNSPNGSRAPSVSEKSDTTFLSRRWYQCRRQCLLLPLPSSPRIPVTVQPPLLAESTPLLQRDHAASSIFYPAHTQLSYNEATSTERTYAATKLFDPLRRVRSEDARVLLFCSS